MLFPRFASWLSVVLLLLAAAATAQDYPNKPVRILTSNPGGSSDVAARLIAQDVSASLGQQVIVENRAGIISIETVAKAPADGYSLLFYGSIIWLTPFLRDNVPWDPIASFSPVTLAVRTPNILVVNPSVPARSVKELVALAKARPGELNYAGVSTASTQYLAAELFKAMAGVNIVGVPYKGGAAALNALLGGEVHLMFPTAATVAPHLQAGKLRPLAVTTAQPSALAPGLPTIAASGLPGYESVSILGVFAPAKTPPAIITRLNQAFVRALHQPRLKEKFFNTGTEVVGRSPGELGAVVKAEMARMGKVIKDAGIRAD